LPTPLSIVTDSAPATSQLRVADVPGEIESGETVNFWICRWSDEVRLSMTLQPTRKNPRAKIATSGGPRNRRVRSISSLSVSKWRNITRVRT
jgi:hypothetical protein